MNQLFNSVYVANEANAKPEMLMMSLLVALLNGLWLAWVYKYKTLYTKDFVITLNSANKKDSSNWDMASGGEIEVTYTIGFN